MTRWMVAMIATGCCLPLAHAVEAQELARATELRITAGVAMHDRRDLSASPMRFDGRGSDFDIEVTSRANRTRLDVTASGGVRALRASSTVSTATERVTQGDLSLSALRTVAQRASGATMWLGAALSGSAMLARHAYSDPSHRSSDFVFGLVAVGPAASARATVLGGALEAGLSVPLAGVVDHAYSVVNERDAGTNRRIASPARLRAATASMSFASPASHRVGVAYLYRLALLRYDDVQPIRAMTQSFSIGVVARLGSSGARR
jgi:hypothetical protein